MTICKFPECQRVPRCKGYCSGHYQQQRKGFPLTPLRPNRGKAPAAPCPTEGCGKPIRRNGLCDRCHSKARYADVGSPRCEYPTCGRVAHAAGLCVSHRQQQRRGEDLHPIRGPHATPSGRGFITHDGYVYISRMWEHPNAHKSGRIAEHVLVMSEHLGRPLVKGENVHHRNGDRTDNRIENLELWTRAQPSGQRVADRIEYALAVLAQYGSDPERFR